MKSAFAVISIHTIAVLLSAVLWAAPTAAADNTSSESGTGAEPPVPELPGRGMESAQEKISDTWITAKVKSLFVYSPVVSAQVINVETMDAVVILSGSVEADSSRDTAIDLARSVRGVRKVNANDLLVRSVRDSGDGAGR